MSETWHEKLVDFSRDDHEPLMRELAAIRLAVYARRQEATADAFHAWRKRLLRHLRWEERSVLPVFADDGARDRTGAVLDHEEGHRILLSLVAELADLLRPGRGPTWEPAVLAALDVVERQLAQHRDRELYGICTVIDGSKPAVTVDRIERDLDES